MNDQEFIADMVGRTTRLGNLNRKINAEKPFREFMRLANDVVRQGISMSQGERYDQQLLARVRETQALIQRIESVVAVRTQMEYDQWLVHCASGTGAPIVHTAEYMAAELGVLRGLVASGTFTSLTVNPGSITVRTTPVTIEYEGQDYAFGVYELTIKPATEVRPGDLNDAIRITGGRSHNNYIHPHLGTNGGCLGTGADPLIRALMNQSWSDAFLLLDQLLRTYNDSSPMHDIENWSEASECPECGSRVSEPDEDDEEDEDSAVVTIDGQLYHARCTVPLSIDGGGRFRLGATSTCVMCGRIDLREHVHGRDGCRSCRAEVQSERELAAVGTAVCHNCYRTWPSDQLDQLIQLGRGDQVCRSCTLFTADGTTVSMHQSSRWNRGYVINHLTSLTNPRSVLRPNCSTMARHTPVIQRPVLVTCSCGVSGMGLPTSPCKVLADKVRCATCDPERTGLSAMAQANPRVCLPLVTAWINTHVHSRVLDFFDFIHPATVSNDMLKRAVRNVLAAQAANSGVPVNCSVELLISRVNHILGYPAILASNEMIGVYDATYNRAQAVA